MDNFFNYITKNLDPEEVDVWFRVNNIIPEKMELYYDFSYGLYLLIKKTYLGGNQINNETKVEMTDEDNTKHFNWCWDKTLFNFKKENIIFEPKGEHYEYLKSLFGELYYKHSKDVIKNSADTFFNDLFDMEKPFTQVDLDLIYNIYKTLDRNLSI